MVGASRAGLSYPGMGFRQHHFRLRQIAGGRADSASEFEQRFDPVERGQVGLLRLDVGQRQAQVLELADRVVGGQRLGKALELFQAGAVILDFRLGEQALSPQRQTTDQLGLGHQQIVDPHRQGGLQVHHRGFVALADQPGMAWRQLAQRKQGPQDGDVEFLRPFQMLEADQLIEGAIHQ